MSNQTHENFNLPFYKWMLIGLVPTVVGRMFEAGMNLSPIFCWLIIVIGLIMLSYCGLGWCFSFIKIKKSDVWKFLAVYFVSLAVISGILFWQFGDLSIFKKTTKFENLKLVVNKHFRNEVVKIDGKRFLSCTFDDVTIEWDGDSYAFDPSDSVVTVMGFRSTDPKIYNSLTFSFAFFPALKEKRLQMEYTENWDK